MLIVGGPDVDSRLDLMERIAPHFSVACAGSDPSLEDVFRSRGFPFRSYPLHGAVSPLTDLRSVAALRRIYHEERPDVVHAFATKPAVWGRLAAGWAGVPVVVGTLPGLGSLYSSHGMVTRALRRGYQALQALSCRKSDATIFQNEHDRLQMVEARVVPSEKAFVIPGSGVRTDLFSREAVAREDVRGLRVDMGAGEGDTVVTMIARLIRPKGVLEFARAARYLRERDAAARFVLVGSVPSQSVDSLSAEELDEIRASVTWLGPRSDVPAVLAASDIFALPSYYREGMPRVLLEAGSMELPLVAADVPGSREIVADGMNGVLVRPKDVDGLAEALLGLLDDPERRARMGRAARIRCEERFDLGVIADHHVELYTELLEGRDGKKNGASAREMPREIASRQAATERGRISR